MKAEYTPGPWQADLTDIVLASDVSIQIGAALFHTKGIDLPTAKANAYLMACAPEMLEILEELVEVTAGYIISPAITKAVRVIKKAKR